MNKENIKRVLDEVGIHASVLLRGLAKVLHGTLVAALIAVAVFGFIVIKSESGYIAVGDFVVSCASLCIAIVNIYWAGMRRGGQK